MTKTEGLISFAQLTASNTAGTAEVKSVAGKSDKVLALQHVNGATGPITAGATAQVQYQLAGSTLWHTLDTYTFGLTTSAVEDRTIDLPESVAAVRYVYTAPTGATGQLDGEIGTDTFA